MQKTPYISEKYRNDPIKFLAKTIGFEKYLSRLQSRPDAEYLLTGVVNYRMIDQKQRMEYMGYVINLPGDRVLGIEFYELAAQQIAQPLWYAWSLTDEEVRELLEGSKDIMSFLQLSGIVPASITAKDVANSILERSKKGLRTAISAKVDSSLNMDISDKMASGKSSSIKATARAASAFITIMALLMYNSAKHDKRRAQEELLYRGLLKEGDLG